MLDKHIYMLASWMILVTANLCKYYSLRCFPSVMIERIYSISNKSTKTIQVQLYTIAKKKRHEMHIFKGRVKGKERNVMAAI